MTIRARDPRVVRPRPAPLALAARPSGLGDRRVVLLQCMPPHNGLEEPIAAARAAAARRYPDVRIDHVLRGNFMLDDAAERQAIGERADAVILFAGPAATSVHVTWAFAAGLERAGVPTAIIVPPELIMTADYERESQAAALRCVASDRADFAAAALAALTAPLTAEEEHPEQLAAIAPARYLADGSEDEVHEALLAAGVTDGLPVAVATDARVAAMLGGTSRRADELVCATLRPEGLPVTIEQVAINAVMAGATPAQLPVILAATSLFGAIELESMTRSVGSFSFLLLVNGPAAPAAGIAGGTNALGAGNPANAAIARALRLLLRNAGGQRIGLNATPAQGSAAGLLVAAENAAESPWPSFHTTLGYDADASAVSLFVGGFTIAGNFYYRDLDALPAQLALFESWSGALLLVSAKRARLLAERGMTPAAIAETLWQGTTASLATVRASGFFPLMRSLIERGSALWPADYLSRPAEDVVPLFPRSGIRVAVVGSTVASVMQLWNSTLQSHASIDAWQ